MKVLYRISDNGYNKPKLENATKKRCLINFLVQWPVEEVTVYADKCAPRTMEFLQGYEEMSQLKLIEINEGSSAQSFRRVVEEALKLPDDEIVYFVEDDYFHLNNSRRALLEGIERADYVTLYDHPDKYVPAKLGGNPFIGDDGADDTRIILTDISHWRMTNSTTCTFATRVGTLREDLPIWKEFCFSTPEQTHPHDFQCFLALGAKGRSLISSIPGFSTHCEPTWLAPLIDWTQV